MCAALLSASALTVNPLAGIRGSSIKVIESLGAGRACVSTEDGARGFIDAGFAGLLTTASVADMADVVIELLQDEERRHRTRSSRRRAACGLSVAPKRGNPECALPGRCLELDGK